MAVHLPTLHAGQVEAFKLKARFKAVRCGRRWGKTEMGIAIACNAAVHGQSFGVFAPDYKILSETYNACSEILGVHAMNSSKVEGVIRMFNRGRIDFWTLNNPRAGRSRKYHGVLLDEVAFAGPDMMDIWEKAIRPSLLDYRGYALALSTPAGVDENNFFYQICTKPEHGFVEYHAPTHTNPYLPADELEKLQRDNRPDVYRQEYLAEFVDWSGTAFFSQDALLQDGLPVPFPDKCDQVFAIIDTALKDGLEHDGTAVLYCARNKYAGVPLILLDWDVIQIEGASLETWLPAVNQRLEELAQITRAREGNVGMWIEDKGSGTILLQQAARSELLTYPIEGALTAMGKEGRALSVSKYVYQGLTKLSQYAFDKVAVYKGQSRNHLLSQVCGFRLGVKTPHKMDLLDCFCYSIAISLGDSYGY